MVGWTDRNVWNITPLKHNLYCIQIHLFMWVPFELQSRYLYHFSAFFCCYYWLNVVIVVVFAALLLRSPSFHLIRDIFPFFILSLLIYLMYQHKWLDFLSFLLYQTTPIFIPLTITPTISKVYSTFLYIYKESGVSFKWFSLKMHHLTAPPLYK